MKQFLSSLCGGQPYNVATMDELDHLLRGISTYQDVVIDGRTVRRGERDCEGRWQAIAPHLPTSGTLLDVGANFCWFSQQWCAGGTDRLAVALEADLRSAAVARYVLARHVLKSHEHQRLALCTARAEAVSMRRFTAAEQRFDAAFCLSVLHWIPDHEMFLAELGRTCERIFVEQPDPREAGAGNDAIRTAIGEIGPYLRRLYPDRPTERIAVWPSHRPTEYPRELWLVGPKPGRADASRSPSVDVATLAELDVAWPPRAWWLDQLSHLGAHENAALRWTACGLQLGGDSSSRLSVAAWRRAFAAFPQSGVTTLPRRVRRLLAAVLRRLR